MLPDGLAVPGAVLVDQVRSVDRIARRLRLAGDAPQTVIAEVQARTVRGSAARRRAPRSRATRRQSPAGRVAARRREP